MLLLGAAYTGIRRAMIKDQRRPIPCDVSLWRLLLEEIGLLISRIGRWKVWTVLGIAFVCFLAVEVALSSSTPGPALDDLWRWLVAAALTAVSLGLWAVLHAVRQAREVDTTQV